MGALFEPLILYILLFFSGSSIRSSEASLMVTPGAELYRIFMYLIPSLALIWYLLYRHPGFNWNNLKPRKSDLISAGFAFPCLLITGLSIALVAPYLGGIPHGPTIIPPTGAVTWLALTFSCILTGYLEESFFRYYLLSRFHEMGLSPVKAVLGSAVLFSVCHLYEGPWGVLNAAISGTLLALVFLRYRSLHGIALSHGLYNIWVYAMSLL